MSALDDPFALGAELAGGLASIAVELKHRSSRFRPEIVRFLFEESWRKVQSAQPETKALLGLWELQMESVSGGLFSVADNRWRRGQSYPDRYFPTLWLHIVPELAESGPDWFEKTVSLFNLGETLTGASRPVANTVAGQLEDAAASLATDFETTLRRVLTQCGILASGGAAGDTYEHFASISLADAEATFLAGSLELSAAGVLWVYEASSPRALIATLTVAGAELQGVHPAADSPAATLSTRVGLREYRVRSGELEISAGGEVRRHPVPLVAPIAVAANGSGLVAIADGLRQRVLLMRPA